MKKTILLLLLAVTVWTISFGQSAGTYANVSLNTGANTITFPVVAPSSTNGLFVSISGNFQGVLTLDPQTGAVLVSNAKPAGNYIVTIKTSGTTPVSTSFVLTVSNSLCSQGLFSGTNNFPVANLPYAAAIGDFNLDGKQDVAIANYGINTVSIRLGDGLGNFTGNSNFTVGQNPQSIAIADFDLDGKQDLLVTNFVSNTISILYGTGNGDFSLPLHIPVGSLPYAAVAADFNNDGRPDIAAANYGSNNVFILMANAAGFDAPISINVGSGPRSLVTGDFNLDGRQDLASANYLDNTISIRLGNGAGIFTGGTVATGTNPHSIAMADFNNDGKQDLATANLNSGTASIRIGDGLGNFTGAAEINVGNTARSICTGDFNGDGKQDFATANYSLNAVSVKLGDGTGNFTGNTTVAVENSPFAVVTGDFNADGKLDLLTANAGNNSFSVRLGTLNQVNVLGNNILIADADTSPSLTDDTDFGNVTNNVQHNFSIHNPGTVNLLIRNITSSGTNASMFTIGAVGYPKIIPPGVTETFQVTFVPTSTGIKNAVVNISTDNCDKANYDFAVQGNGIELVPILGNYQNTIITTAGGNITIEPTVAPANTENITVYTSSSFKGILSADPVTGIVTVTNAYPAGVYNVTIKANGVSTASTNFLLTVNNSSCSQGQFNSAGNMNTGSLPSSAVTGDFNRDGIQDLAIANMGSGTVSLLNGNGSGIFTANTELITAGAGSIVTADFNSDGLHDIATANSINNSISIITALSSGGFGNSFTINSGNEPMSISTGDFNADGKADLVTANYGTNDVSVFLGDGLGAINSTQTVSVGINPRSVAIADFNGDGKQDMVTANAGSNTISILIGNGLGGFVLLRTDTVGAQPFAVTTGDFNADGKQDIAVANHNSNNVSIMLGNGAGNFSSMASVTVGAGPASITIADFNGDGKQDLATANNSGNSISVRLGNGSGGFATGDNVVTGNGPSFIAIGDFNADGKEDMAITHSTGNHVSIRLASENDINVLGNAIVIADGTTVASTEDHTDFGDVSGNLVRTFTIQNTSTVGLTVSSISLQGTGASFFTVAGISYPFLIPPGGSIPFTVAFIPTSGGIKTATIIIASDNCTKSNYDFTLQGNGVVLLPVLASYPATNMASGGNTQVIPAAAPANTQNVTAFTSSSFKGLLQVDIATGIVTVTNAHPAGVYNITIKAYGISTATSNFLLTVTNTGCSQAKFGVVPDVPVGNKPFSVAVGDFNNDGRQDLVTANYFDNNISIRTGDGNGNFNTGVNVPVGSNPYSVAVGDFNGDGKQDIAAANHNSATVSIRIGDGNGNFIGNTEIPVGTFPTLVIINDFNGDGKQDIAVGVLSSNSISIRLGDGAGNFNGSLSAPAGSGPFSITTGDFNADGILDLASANYNISDVIVNLGTGNGNFTGVSSFDVGLNPYSITVADFNADGKQDIATANYNSNSVSIGFGDGTGNFNNISTVAVGQGPGSVTTADFNGDGHIDIATANYSSNSISIRLGDGTGNFIGTTNLPMGIGPGSLAIGDFNADAKQDIAVANNNSNTVTVRIGIDKEINVTGNALNIADGSNTVSTTDNTDFGITNNVTHSFVIHNDGKLALTVSNISISGINASLFSLNGITFPSSIAPGNSVSFAVTFVPLNVGIKKAQINVFSDDCDESIYDFAVEGMFACPATVIGFTPLLPSYCIDAPMLTLTGSQSTGSLFTGNGISNTAPGIAVFNPVVAGIGEHVIQYDYTDNFGCTYNFAQTVIINSLPVLSFTGLAGNYCTTDLPVMLISDQPGGLFVSSGGGLISNGDGTAVFDPAMAGAGGPYTITYSYTNVNGCTNTISQQTSVVVCPTYSTLKLKLFLEGFYAAPHLMRSNLFDLGISIDPAEADTIEVNLWSPENLSNTEPEHSLQTVLHTDGTASMQFPASVIDGAWYIAVKHRNHLETWSRLPVLFSSTTNFDFSIALEQAFDDGINPAMAAMPGAVFAFYGGDTNGDGGVDASDLSDTYNDSNLFLFGYYETDVTGDGGPDASDLALIYNNSQLFLFYARPY